MNDWHYFFQHTHNLLDAGIYRIFEPEWKAQILHWFGQEDVDIAEKEDFVKALIDFDDGCGNFYRYRAYFLAAEAIAYFPDCSLGDAIVEQILKWSYAYFRQDKRDWKIYPQPLVEAARAALEVTDRKRVIAAYTHLLRTTESRSILRIAAEKLGKLDLGNKSAIAALVLLIQVSHDEYWEYWYAILSLGEIGFGNETAIATLVHIIIQTPPNENIYWLAVKTLGQIGYGSQSALAKPNEVIAALVEFLEANQAEYIGFFETAEVLLEVARDLWQIDPGNVVAIDTLVKILEATGNPSLFFTAAEYLLQIDPSNKAAITILNQRLEATQDERLRPHVAVSQLAFEPGNVAAFNTLVHLLENTQDEWTVLNTTFELRRIGVGSEVTMAALTQLLQTSQYEDILREAAYSLGQIDPGNEIALATLVKLIQTTENTDISQEAAYNLGQIDPGNEIAIATLVRLIQTYQDNDENEFDDDEICFTETFSYEDKLLYIANYLREILPSDQMPQVVTGLKDYLEEQFYKNSSYRYEAVLNIIWHCAQNMTYPEFYNAWHNSPRV